ncbi:hypothetical protein [Nonomuraea lactucae]|uniref:hypothetical protein n=1 Tax=Nonomuraea lactucae TaxID=2249762 RepID=UPI0013B3F4C8|nr:hypothetical protein [Nonomuraea lactucae]
MATPDTLITLAVCLVSFLAGFLTHEALNAINARQLDTTDATDAASRNTDAYPCREGGTRS